MDPELDEMLLAAEQEERDIKEREKVAASSRIMAEIEAETEMSYEEIKKWLKSLRYADLQENQRAAYRKLVEYLKDAQEGKEPEGYNIKGVGLIKHSIRLIKGSSGA